MSDAENPDIVEGLAALAISAAEMGASDADIASQILGWLVHLRIDESETYAVVRAAAKSIAHFPAPELETAEQTERRRHVREMLGVKSADEQLSAMLRARDVLQRLAEDVRP